MASTIKVNNIQNQCGANIVNKCSTTITLGASGDNITLACGATQSGFGRTGTVDWDTTAKTASFTAVSGNGYFVNTTSGAITVTLPAGSAGDIVSLADYTNTWQTNNVTVTPNGSDKIGGRNSSATLSTQGQSVTFVYVDATEGWKNVQDSTSNVTGFLGITATGGTVTTCGNYKIHTFTSPGTFCVSALSSNPTYNAVDYLVIAGGGGGGGGYPTSGTGGGGAGAGGYREAKTGNSGCYTTSPLATPTGITVTATGYPITVGGGGAGTPPGGPGARGSNGSNSVFSTITSAGGGGAGSRDISCVGGQPGSAGGSGGGGSFQPGATGTGGAGNTPPVSPPQGQPGGDYNPCAGSAPGGGGGATTAGPPGPASDVGGPGGAGGTSSINGTPTGRAGGGGGAGSANSPSTNATDGGGSGAATPATVGSNGTANTGGGAGGGLGSGGGGTGGSGIVIIRYKYQ